MKEVKVIKTGKIIKARESSTLHDRFEGWRVDDVYSTRASSAKRTAEREILDDMDRFGGYGYHITGHNNFIFGAAWYLEVEDVKTGELLEMYIKESASDRKFYILKNSERGYNLILD